MGTPSFRFVALSINFSTNHRLLSDIDCSTIRWTMLLMAFQIDWNMIPKTFLLALSLSLRTRSAGWIQLSRDFGFRAPRAWGLKSFKWIRSMVSLLFCGLSVDYHFRDKTRTRVRRDDNAIANEYRRNEGFQGRLSRGFVTSGNEFH